MICRSYRTWGVLLALLDFRASEQESRIYDAVQDRVRQAHPSEYMCFDLGDEDAKIVNKMLTEGILADKE